jgi:phage tail sheath protein FI
MATYTYPGVYIEEISSGVHTITGVATSIAAFVGWAPMGTTDEAWLVQSWSDFESQFGGLDSRSLLGYAVNQFFGNGGQQAYIVRLVATDAKVGANDVTANGGGNAFHVEAVDAGGWSATYGIRIVVHPEDSKRFSLLVVQTPSATEEITVESFPNLTTSDNDPQSRKIDSVVNDAANGSRIVSIKSVTAGSVPTPNPLTDPATLGPTMLKNGAEGSVLNPDPASTTHAAFLTALNHDNAVSGVGVRLLDTVPIFNLLCVPGLTDTTPIDNLQQYCYESRAFYIVDSKSTDDFTSVQTSLNGLTKAHAINSALYFPWVSAPDSLQQGRLRTFPPCGFVAGIYAATDSTRGVWKAPAGVDSSLTGESGLTVPLTDVQNGTLNTQGINCLRHFPVYGDVIWGARTLRGNDQIGSEWKYVPIRRFALFLESSLYEGTQWVVFEPNDETLWGQIRMNVGAFMQGLFLKGAFQGTTPAQAYFVKCDSENNPQSSINQGVVNILVGFAPLNPAEFVVIQIQQMAGQLQT